MFYLGLRTREWVDAVGWVRMTTSRLGNRSQLELGFAAGLAGFSFSQQYIYILVDTGHLHVSQHFYGAQGEK